MANEPHGDLPSLPVEERTKKRTDELHDLQQWCFQRIAQLEQQNDTEAARCLKREHLELLMKADSHRTLLMRIDYDPEG